MIARETSAAPHDARRTIRYAVLIEGTRLPKLNENQQTILAELAGSGNELPIAELRRIAVPPSTLATLVRRELVRIEERPADSSEQPLFAAPADSHPQRRSTSGSRHHHRGRPGRRVPPASAASITGSGKTAVYVAAMQRALTAGKRHSARAGDRPHARHRRADGRAFGSEVALLHSALTPTSAASSGTASVAARPASSSAHARPFSLRSQPRPHPRRRRTRRQLQAGRDAALPRP